jgi:FkbM family methyltransferase
MKHFLIKHLPFLGKYKRYYKAFLNSMAGARQSYSQYGEDEFIFDTLKKIRSNPADEIYIDVGANHPTDISNTYLLYRNGYKGIAIEPNRELINLFKRFRKRDIALEIGCGAEAAVLPFYISPTPVISSFKQSADNAGYQKKYIPVFPLDNVLLKLDISGITFLSIDVEGMNYEVLQGAAVTLSKCKIICIEFDDDVEKEKIKQLLMQHFELIREIHCNLIFLNRSYTPS